MNRRLEVISIIGLGYVGLCTAATFASRGFHTIGIDIDQERIRQILHGKTPVHEPRLDRMLRTAVKTKLLQPTTDISNAASSKWSFLTVGTPGQPDGSIDLSHLKGAAKELGRVFKGKDSYHLVVVKSTVVPGTTSGTVRPILEEATGDTIGTKLGLCVNPEFLAEGTAIHDALHPDKIVIGYDDEKSCDQLIKLYRRFYGANLPPVLRMSPETAELVKYSSNAFLATKVSFINTIANIAEQTFGVDVGKIAEAIGYDPRIGKLFLKAGPGYGGSCFHKDLQALISFSRQRGYDPELLQATEQVNKEQARRVVEKVERLLGSVANKRIAILGLSFKKDTDDVREAASLNVINLLLEKRARVVAYDPMAMPTAKKLLDDKIDFAESSKSAVRGADCCILMTEWDEFKRLKPKHFLAYMKTSMIVDARRVYAPEQMNELSYLAVGLGPRN